MKCGCEVQDVETELCSVKKVFVWRCIATWSHAGHVPGRQKCKTLAHSAHTRACLAHGACKSYKREKSYSRFPRQLRPRFERALELFYAYTYKNISRNLSTRTNFHLNYLLLSFVYYVFWTLKIWGVVTDNTLNHPLKCKDGVVVRLWAWSCTRVLKLGPTHER